MIFVDSIGHMVSDANLEELHVFAHRIGLNRRWFQGSRKNHPHYDLTTSMVRARAIRYGAKLIASKNLVREMVRGRE